MLGKKCVVKSDISNYFKKGDTGVVTSYLPEDAIFSVQFDTNLWVTFKDSEGWFLDHFEEMTISDLLHARIDELIDRWMIGDIDHAYWYQRTASTELHDMVDEICGQTK